MKNDDIFDPKERLTRDIMDSAKLLGRQQIRFLLDSYYQYQENRKALDNQIRSAESQEPNGLLSWAAASNRKFENTLSKALDVVTDEYLITRWMKSITGIGTIISAGLLTRLDIRKAKVAAQFWNYCGLSPGQKLEKGKICTYNIKLKKLCFNIGDCFIKFQNHKNDYYGSYFRVRKEYETAVNARMGYRELAERVLREKNYGEDTKAIGFYRNGQLPPAHIHMRCLRWTTKIFLSHLHHAMYVNFYGIDPPVPYAFSGLCEGNHAHFIPLPNWPFTDGGKSLKELYDIVEPQLQPEPDNQV